MTTMTTEISCLIFIWYLDYTLESRASDVASDPSFASLWLWIPWIFNKCFGIFRILQRILQREHESPRLLRPVCILSLCLFMSLRRPNVLPQTSQANLCLSLPCTMYIWLARLVTRAPHTWQLSFTPSCFIFLCIFTCDLLLQGNPHTSHLKGLFLACFCSIWIERLQTWRNNHD